MLSKTAAAKGCPADRERELVLAARRGDEDAIREIYGIYREPVWGVVISLLGDHAQAQDVFQDVFFKVFRGLAGFRFRSALFPWIYRIARNECWSHLRRRVPHMTLEHLRGSRHEIDGQERSERFQTNVQALRDAVGRLPLKMREVLVLKYQEDLSYGEMSRVLGCPPGTVASRLNRALAELGARLQEASGTAEAKAKGREGER